VSASPDIPTLYRQGTIIPTVDAVTADLFDAAARYGEDYLHFFASPETGGAPTQGPGRRYGVHRRVHRR
jgi:hypothetical protein